MTYNEYSQPSFTQISQQKQHTKVPPQATPPSSVMWNQLLSDQMLQPNQTPPIDLRTQVQPFQDLQPDEIQDQLQKLHIQHPDAPMMVVSGREFDHAPSSAFSAHSTDGGGGGVGGFMHQLSNTSETNSSATLSRKSSSGSSLIVQLLSPSPPAIPIPSPQTEGMATSSTPSSSSNGGSMGHHSPPHSSSPTSLGRKTSLQNPSTIQMQKHSRPHRYL